MLEEQNKFLRSRRSKVASRLGGRPALIAAGQPLSRNFPANRFPFRASSHFLYLAGCSIPGSVLCLSGGQSVLYVPRKGADDALWHGPTPTLAAYSESCGMKVGYLDELSPSPDYLVLPTMDPSTNGLLSKLSGRSIQAGLITEHDETLAQAMVAARLCNDALAISELRKAAAATVAAHRVAQAMIEPDVSCHAIWSAMQAEFTERGMTASYNPIITPQGEVLHAHSLDSVLGAGDLVLLDVGAETRSGWAGDVSRTWAVSGTYSSTQAMIIDVISNAQKVAIEHVKPGVEYRDIHLLASREIAAGLVDIGILIGNPDELVERDAHALFFPHGVGHLLGLDVHDMEDLGDRPGYPDNRERSHRFGLSYLRLDRPLEAGMVVTIEPGFYQVPSLLRDSPLSRRVGDCVNWSRLAEFADVRGVRIEDDILVTAEGYENLTEGA